MTNITISGNTTSEGQLRFTEGGRAVFNFTVAVNERRKDGDQWVDDGATFYDCSIWGQPAENCAESIAAKGTRVLVQGRLRTRVYQNREGQDVTRLSVDVEEVGPTLRFATATVTRAAPSAPSGMTRGRVAEPWQASQQPVANDPWAGQSTDRPPF